MARVLGAALLLTGTTVFAWCAWEIILGLLPWLALTALMCLSMEWGACFGNLGFGATFAIGTFLGGGMSWFGWKLLHPMPSAAGSIVAVSALLVAGGLVAFVGNFQDRSRGAALTQKCKDAGAKFLRKPSMPVRSVAHDWDAAWTYGPEHPVYELDHQGHISGVRGIGVASPGGLDFEERRYSPRQGQFSPSSRPQFVRMYRDRKLNPIDALSADVLILHEVSDLYEKQGPVRHTLTVHDRRSGDILATMTYWIDRKNGLGCGANKGSAIDEGAFIQQAILQ